MDPTRRFGFLGGESKTSTNLIMLQTALKRGKVDDPEAIKIVKNSIPTDKKQLTSLLFDQGGLSPIDKIKLLKILVNEKIIDKTNVAETSPEFHGKALTMIINGLESDKSSESEISKEIKNYFNLMGIKPNGFFMNDWAPANLEKNMLALITKSLNRHADSLVNTHSYQSYQSINKDTRQIESAMQFLKGTFMDSPKHIDGHLHIDKTANDIFYIQNQEAWKSRGTQGIAISISKDGIWINGKPIEQSSPDSINKAMSFLEATLKGPHCPQQNITIPSEKAHQYRSQLLNHFTYNPKLEEAQVPLGDGYSVSMRRNYGEGNIMFIIDPNRDKKIRDVAVIDFRYEKESKIELSEACVRKVEVENKFVMPSTTLTPYDSKDRINIAAMGQKLFV